VYSAYEEEMKYEREGSGERKVSFGGNSNLFGKSTFKKADSFDLGGPIVNSDEEVK